MEYERKTIGSAVGIEGVGLHSGMHTRVELRPAQSGNGIVFVRTDLGGLRIPALQSSTTPLDYATTVGKDDVAIGTVEHLLSALNAYGVSDLDININGPEVPIIDGSALPFAHLLDAAGLRGLGEAIDPIRVRRTIEISDGSKWIRIEPSDKLSIDYRIDFDHPVIRRQAMAFDVERSSFVRKIAPARTFGFVHEVEKLRAAGLARGGSVENCIVLDHQQVTNGKLRFPDEFVRHKILDLIGDLALLGRPLIGETTAFRAGHALHSRFVSALLETSAAFQEEKVWPVSRAARSAMASGAA